MKKYIPLLCLLLVSVSEIAALVVFARQTPSFSQDTVAVNEIVQSVTRDFSSLQTHKNGTKLDYVVTDNDGNVLFKTKSGLSETVNAAVAHRDTVLDINADGAVTGKVIIYNGGADALRAQKKTAVAVLSVAVVLQCALCIAFFVYLHVSVVKPFGKLKGFAERVANGNLDVPLTMDKRNLFGAFTESFDIMRAELKKARLAEAQANQSKKELVAKLSHDIKTPVASIKAVSEVGLALTTGEKAKENYALVIGKADQINTLVTNLFSATLEELQQLTVTPADWESTQLQTLLSNADYLRRALPVDIPPCLVHADRLRLQQVFDNIFANAYKYANTDILLSVRKTDTHLCIEIEDFGGGVPPEELPVLKEKFKRGSKANRVEGAGLGLYISDHFMRKMGGALDLENGAHGLKATVSILLSR